jgi:hypothetical protein
MKFITKDTEEENAVQGGTQYGQESAGMKASTTQQDRVRADEGQLKMALTGLVRSGAGCGLLGRGFIADAANHRLDKMIDALFFCAIHHMETKFRLTL